MKNCPQCQNETAILDNEYGILPGELCQALNSAIPKPTQAHTYDFASPTTKQQRKEYAKSMLQPWVNGVLSKEYIEAWGTDKLMNVTNKDIKNAKYVYKDMTRSHKFKDSKI